MKELFFKYGGFLSSLLSTEAWATLTNKKLIVPVYHTVTDSDADFIHPLYKPFDLKRFSNDLEFLLKHFEAVSIEEALQKTANNQKLKKPSFILTFDDGLSGIYKYVYPILKQKKISAIVFLNTDFIDNRNLFYRFKVALIIQALELQPMLKKPISSLLLDAKIAGKSIKEQLLNITYKQSEILDKILPVCDIDQNHFLETEKPYLTLNQIKEMQQHGFMFGSHGTNHAEFQRLNETECQAQLSDSFMWIESNCSQSLKLFAFPFTDSGIEKKIILKMHHEKWLDFSFGCAGINNDILPTHIQRIPMEKKYAFSASKMIKTEYLYYSLKYLLGKKSVRS